MPDVKFAALVQQRSVQVLLNKKCLETAVGMGLFLFNNGLYFVQVLTVLDSSASVCELAGFYDPACLVQSLVSAIVLCKKFQVLFVLQSRSYVISERDKNLIRRTLFDFFQIHHHHFVQGLLIANSPTELQVVGHFGGTL